MKTESFNYYLPKGLVSQYPCLKRDASSLMILHRDTGNIAHRSFYEIIDLLEAGDVLVVNDTRVIAARIFGKDSKTREILLIKDIEPLVWETFIKPQRGLKIGEELVFDSIRGKINERTSNGTYIIQFSKELPLSSIGYAPLPPYIKRDYSPLALPSPPEYPRGAWVGEDLVHYQTVHAKNPGAIAAPTNFSGIALYNMLLLKL